MRILSPSLPELHAFVCAARLGSYQRAATLLCVTPGAISRAIARVEQHLGCSLFQAQGRQRVLTEAGVRYLQAVAPLLDGLEAVARQAMGQLGHTALRIAVTPSLASHWLIRRLPDFQRQHPEVLLCFEPYRREELPQLVAQGVSLRGGDGHWPPGIEAHFVVGERIVPVCRPTALLREPGLRDPARLLLQPLLAHTMQPELWAHWWRQLGGATDCPAPVARFDQVSQLIEAAAAGLGVALVPRCLIDDDLAAGRLAIAVSQPARNDRGYYLCHAAGAQREPAVSALLHWLLAQGQAHEQACRVADGLPAAAA